MSETTSPPVPPVPPAKTPEQIALEKRQAERTAQKAAARKAAAETKAKNDKYKEAVGKTFSDGETVATVTAFEPSHDIRGIRAEAYLINTGNPNRHDYIHCDSFLKEFQPKE
jgi:Tfp pilus assembly protein FimV